MRVRITKNVPGYVNFEILRRGQEVNLEDGAALSLMADGYAERAEGGAIGRATPAERRETANADPNKRGPGRPRKEA